MNKKTRGIMSPGQLAEQPSTRVCNEQGPMKSVSVKPTKNTYSVTGRGGAGGMSASTKGNSKRGGY